MLMGLAAASTAIAQPVAAATELPPQLPQGPMAPVPAASATAAVPAAVAESTPPSAEALALAKLVRIRYPEALNDDQFKGLIEELDSRLEAGRALRRLSLVNADEPDLTFHA